MRERAYTVAEIDRMREALKFEYIWGRRLKDPRPKPAVVGVHTDENGDVWDIFRGESGRSYKETELSSIVEDRLRTYMLAGIEPEELELTSAPGNTPAGSASPE